MGHGRLRTGRGARDLADRLTALKIAVLKEAAADERRVAATPETVKKFIALGAEVAVESGAGATASVADADYTAAGATRRHRARRR